MGFSLSWYAVKGKVPEDVLRDLGLRSTGVHVGWDHAAPNTATSLPGGWYLVSRNRHEFKESTLERLSRDAEVVACFVEEHVMFSKAAGWKDGKELWSVVHDFQKHARHLEARGQLPREFVSIRDRLLADQASESEECDHIFEIPPETAASLTDFEHDAVRKDLTFEVLERVPFFQRMFGR